MKFDSIFIRVLEVPKDVVSERSKCMHFECKKGGRGGGGLP